MTEDQAVQSLLEETKQDSNDIPGSKIAACCVDAEYVVEVIEPLLRRAYQAGKASQ